MSERTQELRVGVVTLVLSGVAAVLATFGAGVSLPLGASTYQIKIRTDRAPGVGENTPVRKDGVVIGRVASAEFLPEGGVLITADIQPGAPIYQSDTASIRPSSLFGDAVINFSYAEGGPVPPQRLAPGSLVAASSLPDPIEALTSLQVDVGPTIESIGRAATAVEELTTKVNRALGDDFGGERMTSLVDDMTVSMREFQATMQVMERTMTQVETLVSDPDLQRGINEIPALLTDARTTVQKATQTLDQFGGVVNSAETNLRNLEGFTKPLGDQGPELSQKLVSAIDNLDRTLADASRFVGAATASRGTLNRLLNDPEMYDEVQRTIANANAVLYQMDQRLKQVRPILDDARVFTDKIAREPGRLVGGALNQGPGLK
jgi:phospholipid/cholesterol/gamma-HCH transport system substrate-binding protein